MQQSSSSDDGEFSFQGLAPGRVAGFQVGRRESAGFLADLDAYLRLDSDSAAGRRAKELRAQTELNLAKIQVSAQR